MGSIRDIRRDHVPVSRGESAIASSRLLPTVLVAVLLAGCQPAGQRPSVSIDVAQATAAEFQGRAASGGDTAPPSVDDILAVLDRDRTLHPEAVSEALAVVDLPPPAGAGDYDVAEFFLRRGQAAHTLGRSMQERDDYSRALESARRADHPELAQFMMAAASGEGRSGSQGESRRLFAEARDAAVARGNYHRAVSTAQLVVSVLARSGDLDGVERWAAQAREDAGKVGSRARWSPMNKAYLPRSLAFIEGEVLAVHGRTREASERLEEALAMWAPYRTVRKQGWEADLSMRWYTWVATRQADVLREQGRLLEAELWARRALAGAIEATGRNSDHTGDRAGALIRVLEDQGRYRQARRLAEARIDILRQVGARPDASTLLQARLDLVRLLVGQGEYEAAVGEWEQSLAAVADGADRRLALPFEKRDVMVPYALVRVGRAPEAANLLRERFLRLAERLGEENYLSAELRGFLAIALAASGDTHAAEREFAASVPVLLEGAGKAAEAETSQSARAWRLDRIVEGWLALLATRAAAGDANAIAESFRLSDTLRGRGVQRALSAATARARLGDPRLAELARREQDNRHGLKALHGALSAALASDVDAATVERIRGSIEALRAEGANLHAEIAASFPDYAELTDPRPVSAAEAQSLLRPREALVATYTTDDASFVWTLPAAGRLVFTSTPIGRDELRAKVARLRRALEPDAETLGDIPAFDVEAAHALYTALLAPSAATWRGADTLLVSTHDALSQLPLAVLPTAPPTLGEKRAPLFSHYRDVPWLANTHAVANLPSVTSLRSLRGRPRGTHVAGTFAGFGDPVFGSGGDVLSPLPSSPRAPVVEVEQAARQALSVVGHGQDLLSLRSVPLVRRSAPMRRRGDGASVEGLPPLPETAGELRALAGSLGADPDADVFLGPRASETRVKTMPLNDRGVLAFATHGLVPGDLDGLMQPALAMSSPASTGESGEDGLLTMGEILGLELDADWVVLSACNTAAGAGAGAEAVSGLGRAFLYAGARSLLVTHWPVETHSARALTSGVFARQAGTPGLARAEALRASQAGMIEDGGYVLPDSGEVVFSYAHPIFWAPFVLVGDGG